MSAPENSDLPISPIDFNDGYGDRLEVCYSGALYDVLRGMGLPDQIFLRTIRPLDPARALAGWLGGGLPTE
jgi:hypothetical protein